MNDNRERAAHLLKYYLRMIARHSGAEWDSDNDAEVEEIVDAIIAAAAEEATPSRAAIIAAHADAGL